MVGSLVAGRYQLERVIGRGGSGAVWLGHDELLGRRVAVKQLGVTDEENGLERAEREGRISAQLSHPNVVAVYDLVGHRSATADPGAGWAQWDQWLVMEYVDGDALASIIRSRGAVPTQVAAEAVAQVADGLAAAHEAGIVHRDVKPSNVLVTRDGTAKLSDFGIARGIADPSLTRTGLVTGSPAYLAPEVASGQSATPASDVWSLGATLFHAVSGSAPYQVASSEPSDLLATMYRIVHEPTPRLDDAGWLAPVLEHTMHHDPAQRWSAAQVRDYLRSPASRTRRLTPLRPPEQATVTSAAPERRAKVGFFTIAVAALVAFIAITLLASWWSISHDGSAPSASVGAGSSKKTSSPSSSSSAQADRKAKAEAMRAFARDYVRNAAADPASGFAMLTSSYQSASGGLSGYQRFWGRITKVFSVSDVVADPAAMTVSYRYRYHLRGGPPRSERVELQLVALDDGSFRIAGAA